MSDLPLVEWDHALFSELFTLLGRVATQPVNPPLRRLQARLEDAKPWLLALTNVTSPNDADKNAVANGKLSFLDKYKWSQLISRPHRPTQWLISPHNK